MLRSLIQIICISIFIFVGSLKAQTSVYNTFLQNFVSSSGEVKYGAIKKDPALLNNYINYLNKTTPDKSWSKNKQKAFWMNAYNAYTVKLIIDNYPVASIKDIREFLTGPWDLEFVVIGGKTYTLNDIEHEILRKEFNDPRIHVGINCASFSCPPLAQYAFNEANVDAKLDELMIDFLKDQSRNKITATKLELSSIFDWFKEDFTKKGSLIDYLNKYASVKIEQNAKVSYIKYNWNLNGY